MRLVPLTVDGNVSDIMSPPPPPSGSLDDRERHIRAAWSRADGWQRLADKLEGLPALKAMCEACADSELTLAADLLADLQATADRIADDG